VTLVVDFTFICVVDVVGRIFVVVVGVDCDWVCENDESEIVDKVDSIFVVGVVVAAVVVVVVVDDKISVVKNVVSIDVLVKIVFDVVVGVNVDSVK